MPLLLGNVRSLAPFQALIEASPDPQQCRHFLQRMHPEPFERILGNPAAARLAVTVFAFSRFLSEFVLREPASLEEMSRPADLHRVLTKEDYQRRLNACPHNRQAGVPAAERAARFRRRELLRILLRDVLALGSLSDVTEEISNLADAILEFALATVRTQLAAECAAPEGGEFSVIALGKLGGQELNYSSDIDLMFVYSGTAPGHKEYFAKAATRLTEMLSTYTSEGVCYRVDLRLRPYGKHGELCHSLEAARGYYKDRARDWELQMLIKARVAAGDAGPGRDLLHFVEPLIYSTTLDFQAVESVSEARERIHEKLTRARQGCLNIKLARGGIRDIEFLAQCLQRLYGGREPWVRHGGTMMALFRLRDKNFLSGREYARLAAAYQFLRHLEHRLQMQDDRQLHTLPAGPRDLETLARKMPPSSVSAPDAESLLGEVQQHFTAVRDLYERVIHSRLANYGESPAASGAVAALPVANLSGNLTRFLEQRAPRFMRELREASVTREQVRLEHFLENIAGEPGRLELLELSPELSRATLDFFEYSPFFGDQLIRNPSLLLEIAEACGERQGRVGFHAPEDIQELRRYYREQMVRIQSDSISRCVNVFKTLKRTSDLAGAVIAAAYRIALKKTCETHPPRGSTYAPDSQMMVIALGRLGMREFDLASDADLVFVIPDGDAGEIAFWTAVAERLIHVIGAYTGDGVIFTIDTRLRPNGREGDLVQTESVYKAYFAQNAEAWEGIAYLKARGVAGDTERATAFLNELQEVDWRRYGQSGRSRRQLAEMRAKIEKELGTRNPLKAGPGGYYDIDFALLYLRLKGAGIFFKVLNTPERIDVVEKMGHLDRESAEFLREAATLYRAIDHGMRVSTGQAEGSLPTSPASLAMLCELVRRWAPERLREQRSEALLQSDLGHVRTRTRAFFDQIFG